MTARLQASKRAAQQPQGAQVPRGPHDGATSCPAHGKLTLWTGGVGCPSRLSGTGSRDSPTPQPFGFRRAEGLRGSAHWQRDKCLEGGLPKTDRLPHHATTLMNRSPGCEERGSQAARIGALGSGCSVGGQQPTITNQCKPRNLPPMPQLIEWKHHPQRACSGVAFIALATGMAALELLLGAKSGRGACRQDGLPALQWHPGQCGRACGAHVV